VKEAVFIARIVKTRKYNTVYKDINTMWQHAKFSIGTADCAYNYSCSLEDISAKIILARNDLLP